MEAKREEAARKKEKFRWVRIRVILCVEGGDPDFPCKNGDWVLVCVCDGQEVQQREHEEEMRARLRRSESIEKAAVSIL